MTSKMTQLDRIERNLRTLLSWSIDIMTDIASINAQLDVLKAKADENAATVNNALGLLQGLKASVDDLKGQLAGGAVVTAADLDAVAAKIAAITTELTTSETALEQGVVDNTPQPPAPPAA